MTDSIKPPWAISLWYNSDSLFVELPAIDGKTSHVVKVPNNEKGLSKILTLAKSRDITSRLGHKGDPTQWQINKPNYDPKMVRRVKEKIEYTAKQRIAARAVLREFGLI